MTTAKRASGFEVRVADWLTVPDATSRILGAVEPLPLEKVPLSEAEGRALAEQVEATATLPPWDNSAMDGYAVRAEDISDATPDSPAALPVMGIVRAGDAAEVEVRPGEAVRIMTGAPVPRGADTIIRVEDTDGEAEEGRVRILQARDRGRHVRPAGQDMRSGELLLSPGQTLTPGAIGVLAAAGRDCITVHRAPAVGLLSTGDELRTADRYDEVEAGRAIPESNVPMLSAMARSVGARPVDLGIAADTIDDLRKRLEEAADCDVLVTIGGASMGEADLVKRVLDTLGFEQDFWRVKMRPGSPISFGWLPRGGRRQPVFGLPGNPSSAFVTFEVFVRPFLLGLAGHDRVRRRRVRCLATEPFDTPASLTYFQRVVLSHDERGLRASLAGPQISGLVTGLARADGLAIVPPEVDRLKEGDPVDVILLDQRAIEPIV